MSESRRRHKYTQDVLGPLVAESASVAEVLRRLGLRQNGGTHAHISRAIKEFGLDTSHFVRFPVRYVRPRRTAEEILVRRPEDSLREGRANLKRALIETGVPYVCAICGCDGTWQGLPLVLDVDHIDGDFLNNEAANLRFLCPNCHRQTPNFAGRSAGRYTATFASAPPA